MPLGLLTISDEINLKLILDIMSEDPYLTACEISFRETFVTIIDMHGRTGKKEGKGFYDYPKGEKK